jgi:hypothetical protein
MGQPRPPQMRGRDRRIAHHSEVPCRQGIVALPLLMAASQPLGSGRILIQDSSAALLARSPSLLLVRGPSRFFDPHRPGYSSPLRAESYTVSRYHNMRPSRFHQILPPPAAAHASSVLPHRRRDRTQSRSPLEPAPESTAQR